MHPFTGQTLPIVLDVELVDMSLGTGAVKITPAHDANDFEAGVRHALPALTVIDQHGMMTVGRGEMFEGLPRFEARVAVRLSFIFF